MDSKDIQLSSGDMESNTLESEIGICGGIHSDE